MPNTIPRRRQRTTIEAQFALAERAIKTLNRTIDEQIARARDIEVQHALALLKSGKAELLDADAVIREARQRVG